MNHEWKEYDGEDKRFHYCSKCGQAAFNYEDGNEVAELLSDFCPWCGEPLTKNGKTKNDKEAKLLTAKVEAREERIKTLEKIVKEYQEIIVPGYKKRTEEIEEKLKKAIGTIFEYSGCGECKYWEQEKDWCKKYGICAGWNDRCALIEWKGLEENKNV